MIPFGALSLADSVAIVFTINSEQALVALHTGRSSFAMAVMYIMELMNFSRVEILVVIPNFQQDLRSVSGRYES